MTSHRTDRAISTQAAEQGARKIQSHTERLNRKVGSSHPTVLRPELNDRQCETAAVGHIQLAATIRQWGNAGRHSGQRASGLFVAKATGPQDFSQLEPRA